MPDSSILEIGCVSCCACCLLTFQGRLGANTCCVSQADVELGDDDVLYDDDFDDEATMRELEALG